MEATDGEQSAQSTSAAGGTLIQASTWRGGRPRSQSSTSPRQAGSVESVEVPQPCGCQQDSRFHEVNTAEVLQGVVVWTLLEGGQFAEDPR